MNCTNFTKNNDKQKSDSQLLNYIHHQSMGPQVLWPGSFLFLYIVVISLSLISLRDHAQIQYILFCLYKTCTLIQYTGKSSFLS